MGSYVFTGEKEFAISSGHSLARRAMQKMISGQHINYSEVEAVLIASGMKKTEGKVHSCPSKVQPEYAIEIDIGKPGEPLYFITRKAQIKGEWEDESDSVDL